MGGHWAMLRPIAREVYLAAAMHARRVSLASSPHLGQIACTAPTNDLWQAAQLDDGHTRFAVMSTNELRRATGRSAAAIHEAINSLKHPSIWQCSPNCAAVMRFHPIWVYPARRGGSRIFHFRDHAVHWPWDVLNAPTRQARTLALRTYLSTATGTLGEELRDAAA
jgi:hypothetical protein